MKRPMECQESHDVMNLYRLCKDLGALPKAGGIMDQDAVVVHLFILISALVDEAEANNRRGQD